MSTFETRSEKGNAVLEELYESIRVDNDDCIDRVKAAAELHKQLVEDQRNENNVTIEREKIEAQKERDDADRMGKWFDRLLSGLQIVATFVTAIATVKITEANINARFDKATRFEENDAFVTTTERTTVTDGLRSKRR